MIGELIGMAFGTIPTTNEIEHVATHTTSSCLYGEGSSAALSLEPGARTPPSRMFRMQHADPASRSV